MVLFVLGLIHVRHCINRFNCAISNSCRNFQFHLSHSVMTDSLQPHGLQHTRPPCPSPTPRVYSNSHPSCRWCHPTISFSAVPFSSRLQSFPASGSFPMSQFFASGGQCIGVSASASVLPRIFRLRELVMDRESCHAAVHGVAKSGTQPSDWTELNWITYNEKESEK